MTLLFFIVVALSLVHSGNTQGVDINPCIIGSDVIVITDVRTDDQSQVLKLLNFFGKMADLVDTEDTRFYVLGYPRVYTNPRTGSQRITSTYLHLKHQIRPVQSFMQSSMDDRSAHPDFNVALRHVNNLLKTTRSYVPTTVIIFSYNRYHPPVTSTEEADSEEALETPSKVLMARLGESIKKNADVFIYAIGTFENQYELYDLASCRDARCIFKLDRFDDLSMSHLLKGCPAK